MCSRVAADDLPCSSNLTEVTLIVADVQYDTLGRRATMTLGNGTQRDFEYSADDQRYLTEDSVTGINSLTLEAFVLEMGSTDPRRSRRETRSP